MVYIYIYTNIRGILMGSMLPYIAAPWIIWVMTVMIYIDCTFYGDFP